MAEPTLFDKKPAVLTLDAGDYWWCSCGLSDNQPFCNGAHKGSEFNPIQITLEETQKVALCNCKKTQNPPFCDGAHSQL
jgi:CDGSH-type Zn-finger protein